MTPTSLHKWYMNPLLTRFGKHSEYIISLWFLIPFLHTIHLVPKSRGHSLTLETFMKWSTLCIKPYDHEDRVNRLSMRSQGGRDTLGGIFCVGEVTEVWQVAPTIWLWLQQEKNEDSLTDGAVRQQSKKILLRGQIPGWISVRHFFDSSCH